MEKFVFNVKAKGYLQQHWDYRIYTGLLTHNSRFIFSHANKRCVKFNGHSFRDLHMTATFAQAHDHYTFMTHPKNVTILGNLGYSISVVQLL